jgi:hypothetical protein
VSLIFVFELEFCPTATGALALAMWRGGFTLQTALTVLPATMKGWSTRDTNTTKSVFSEETWWYAYARRVQDGLDTVQVALALVSKYRNLWALRIVELLSATFVLVTPDKAAAPIATALKAIGTAYPVALDALEKFFDRDWTKKNTEEVLRVYTGPIST